MGAVRSTQSVDAIDRETRRDQYALIGVGALALLLGLVVAWFVAGSLARPLRSLASTARRVGRGDLDVRAEVEGSAEQQEVARAFNTMADRLTHSLDAQREFVANASHQLRTPLTGLRLRVEAASMATDDPAVQEELAAAEAETVRLARLITNLLTLASADAPAPPSEPVDFAPQRERRRRAGAGRAERRGPPGRVRARGRGDRPRQCRRHRDEPRQPDRERARARAGGQHRHDHLGPRRRARPSSPCSTTAPGSRPRTPWRPSSASSAVLRGPSGTAAPGSVWRSSER